MDIYTDYEKPIEMDRLYQWWFTYNPMTQVWCACHNEYKNAVYNDHTSPNVIRSKSIDTLIELIIRTDGNIEEMNKLCQIIA